MKNETNVIESKSQYSDSALNVLRNMYMLLSVTTAWSAIVGFISLEMEIHKTWLFSSGAGLIVGFIMLIGLIFAIKKTQNSGWGLVWTFAFTGYFGAFMAAVLQAKAEVVGGGVIVTAMTASATIFLALSMFTYVRGKDYSSMGGYLFATLIAVIVLCILNIFLGLSWLSLGISIIAVAMYSGFVIYDTSNVLNGHEDNYISATVNQYINLTGLLLHLTNILGFTSSD